MVLRVKQLVLDLIEQKYSIVEIIDLLDYDFELDALATTLHKFKNYKFENNQRIVVLHHDTDYYPSGESVGNTVYNFFRLCSNFEIPLDKILILTNHYGIEKEIKKISKSMCNTQSPKVICTSQWFDFPNIDDNNTKSSDHNVEYLYCCLNGYRRQHRIMTLCFLEHYKLINKGIVSYHFDR